MVTTAQHIIAQSSNGSLFAVQSSNSSSVIRCYDGSVTNGSLKFTLRVPPSPSKKDASSFIGAGDHNNDATNNNDPIRKLVFASPSSSSSSSPSSKYLCALREYTILIYDLDRGVVSHTLNVRDDHSSSSGSSSRKSSIGGNEQNKAIVCDAALTDDDQLCVLVFFPSSSSEGNSSGKCRIYQYDLAAGTGQGGASGLKRKIKVGSVSSSSGTSNGDELLPSFGVAVSSSSSSTSNNNKKGGSSSSSSTRVIVIRMNDGIRVCDYQSGEKIGKAHIPLLESTTSSSTDDVGGGGLTVISSVRLSECSRYIVTASKNHITIFNILHKTDDDNDNEKKKKSSVKVVAQLSCNDNSKVSNVELVKTDDGGLNVLAFQPLAGTASLFTCDDLASSSSFDSSSPPLLPKAQFQCDQGGSNHIALIHAAFHSRRPNEELLILFQNISSKKGGSSSSNATLPMQSISYDNDTTKGTVTVGTELAEEIANEGDSKKKKRKATDSVALASGEQGNEASLAMDLTSKKARKGKEIDEEGGSDDDGDFQIDDDEEEEGGEQGQSIAERLALLSSAMEESEDDEEDEDGDGNEQGGNATADTKKSKFKLKSATSETLTTLLTQALTSNDAVQLNIALQVTDRRLVEATVRSLQALDAERVQSSSAGYMSTLMGHIVRRMARRHSLVVPLGVWVKAILAATQRAATSRALQPNMGGGAEDHIVKEAREIALKLGPLRNFLNERVECFPQLLRLDGRLALLSEQL